MCKYFIKELPKKYQFCHQEKLLINSNSNSTPGRDLKLSVVMQDILDSSKSLRLMSCFKETNSFLKYIYNLSLCYMGERCNGSDNERKLKVKNYWMTTYKKLEDNYLKPRQLVDNHRASWKSNRRSWETKWQ